MGHTPEDLEYFSNEQQSLREKQETERYYKRPVSHQIMAWILIVIVVAAFLGTCYWLAFGRF